MIDNISASRVQVKVTPSEPIADSVDGNVGDFGRKYFQVKQEFEHSQALIGSFKRWAWKHRDSSKFARLAANFFAWTSSTTQNAFQTLDALQLHTACYQHFAQIKAQGVGIPRVAHSRRDEDPLVRISIEWREVAKAIAAGTISLENVEEKFKRDPGIVRLAIERDALQFQYASDELRANPDIIKLAFTKKHASILYAKLDKKTSSRWMEWQLAYKMLHLHHAPHLAFASEELVCDKELVMEILEYNGLALQFASAMLQDSLDVVLAAVKEDGRAITFTTPKMRGNKEVVLAAVGQNGHCLRYAHQNLRMDKEIVIAAISQTSAAWAFVHPDIQHDPDVIKAYNASKSRTRLGPTISATPAAPALPKPTKDPIESTTTVKFEEVEVVVTSDLMKPPSLEVVAKAHTKAQINSLLKRCCDSYPITRLVEDFVRSGLLSQALWVVKTQHVDFEHLSIEPDVQEWLRLQLNFQPTAATCLSDLEKMALGASHGLGWGYKSANLMVLKTLSEDVSRQCSSCHVDVPAFLPVGDKEMQAFIKQSYPQLDHDWAQFLATFSSERQEDFKAGKGTLVLNEVAKAKLAAIRARLEVVVKEYTNPQIQTWLEETRPEFVIVRSTGKEDSDSNSNAGGNASLAFIKPNVTDIANASAQVIASYFGEKSILQRIAAYDKSLFDDPPFMPVLVQSMVGEAIGGHGVCDEDVPRSGVMFTRTGKGFGMSELYVGLGNNEGIVSSRVMTDRYTLDPMGGVTRSVQSKPTRFVAIEKKDGEGEVTYECAAIANEGRSLQETPALPDNVAHDMGVLANYFSKQYGSKDGEKALDMEFTVKMNECGEPVIYLLQARPLVKVTTAAEPSYVDLSQLKALAPEQKIKGKTLLDGGCYVRDIDSKDQVIVCQTITEALELYLDAKDKQAQIKTVIIRQSAPGTSHEAVTLRARGVSVLMIDDDLAFSRALEWSQSDHPNFLVDMQRGVVVSAPVPSDFIRPGYACYPMALEYSMKPSPLVMGLHKALTVGSTAPEKVVIEKLYTKFQARLGALIEQWNPQGLDLHSEPKPSLQDLIDQMGSGDEASAHFAAARLLERLRLVTLSQAAGHANFEALPLSRLEMVMVLENITNIMYRQFLPASQKPAQSLDRLYPVRLIEACLFQEEGAVLGGSSYVGCLAAVKRQEEGLSEYAIHTERTLEIGTEESVLAMMPLISLKDIFLQTHSSDIWNAVIKRLAFVDPAVREEVVELILNLRKLNSLATWGNVELVAAMKTVGITCVKDVRTAKVVDLFKYLAKQASDMKPTLTSCGALRQQLKVIHANMGAWQSPDHVKKHLGHLIDEFKAMGFDTDQKSTLSALRTQYLETPSAARKVLLATWLEAIRTYDEVIKSFKGSQHMTYKTDPVLQASDFKRLLEPYREMMGAVQRLASDMGLFATMGNPPMWMAHYLQILDIAHDGYYLQNGSYNFGFGGYNQDKFSPGFINIEPQTLTAMQCRVLLEASPEFNVATATIGNASDYTFSTLWPVTLEDYFTLFHQNMETMVGAIRTREGFNMNALPDELKTYCQAITQNMGLNFQGHVGAINVRGPLIDVDIDVPLRQHAAKVRITYDRSKKPPTTTTSVEMFGNEEHDRWKLTSSAVALIGGVDAKIRVGQPLVNFDSPKSTKFDITTQSLTAAEQTALVYFLQQMAQYSMRPHDSRAYLHSVIQLRQAFGLPASSFAPTPEDIAKGGWFILGKSKPRKRPSA